MGFVRGQGATLRPVCAASSNLTSAPGGGEVLAASRRAAVREMLVLALPTVATMASYTLMQFVDAWMVSRIQPADTVNLAAQGNGGVWAFVPMSIVMGITGVVNTYVSQNLGAGHPERGPAYAWNAVWLSAAAWAVLLLPLAAVMPWIFAAMHLQPGAEETVRASAERLVELESGYARILLTFGLLTMATRAVSQYFYGMHRPGVTLTGALVGNSVNLFMNWVLIYGNLGAPALGVIGAAWATVIATAVEASIPVSVFLSGRYHRRYGTRSAWRPSLAHLRDLVKIGWPPALMFGNEMICWAIFMTSFAGHFGKEHNAAGWIALRYMHLSFMPAVGLSFACTATVGKCLGAGRPDLATQRARVGVAMAMVYMGLCALVFVVFRHDLVGIFLPSDIDPDEAAKVALIGAQIMIIAAVFQVFDGLGITLIGVLRGAGDTVWPGVVTMILAWTCIIGLGGALTFGVPQWGSLGPWSAAGVYIILLGLALWYRFLSGRWRDMHLLEHSAGSQEPSSAGSPSPAMGANS